MVQGASEKEVRRGRQGEGDVLKWQRSFYSTYPLEVGQTILRYFTILLMAFIVNHTNFDKNAISFYS